MQIIHTSPEAITKITKNGLFDDCLFFSVDEYAMGKVGAVYTLEISEDKIVEVCDLDNAEVIDNIMTALDVDEDEAIELLTSNENDLDGDDSWWIQAKQGQCAKLMGFEACEAVDEQGVVYIVPMMGREKDLVNL